MTAQRTLFRAPNEPVVTVVDGLLSISIDRGLRMVAIAQKGGSTLNLPASSAKALAMGILMGVRRLEGT